MLTDKRILKYCEICPVCSIFPRTELFITQDKEPQITAKKSYNTHTITHSRWIQYTFRDRDLYINQPRKYAHTYAHIGISYFDP